MAAEDKLDDTSNSTVTVTATAPIAQDIRPSEYKTRSKHRANKKRLGDKSGTEDEQSAPVYIEPIPRNPSAHIPMSYTNAGPVRLFIASLGNPPPYHATRHSAGHIMLQSIQSYLNLPPLLKSRTYAGGHTSRGVEVSLPQWTLWQCPSQMNISGTPLLKAYKTFLDEIGPDNTLAHGIVILHDEMESNPAKLTLRRGPTSPRGHNGIKSVQQSLQGAGPMGKLTATTQPRFLKVAIGIGRPPGGTRDKDDVSNYVLGLLSSTEKNGIEGKVGELVGMLEGEMARIARAAA